jgi:Tfp pilus assembly protein PilV
MTGLMNVTLRASTTRKASTRAGGGASGIPLKEVLIVVVVVVVVGGKILAMSKFIGADFDDHAKTRGATVKRS